MNFFLNLNSNNYNSWPGVKYFMLWECCYHTNAPLTCTKYKVVAKLRCVADF